MRIVRFLGLKIGELSGLVILCFICYWYANLLAPYLMTTEIDYKTFLMYPLALKILLGFVFLVGSFFILFLIGWIIYKNWEWSE